MPKLTVPATLAGVVLNESLKYDELTEF
jgi:hypothetical protein